MLTELLAALNTSVTAKRTAEEYAYNGFSNSVSFLPSVKLEANKAGKVWIVGMAPIIYEGLTRDRVYQKDYCVQIAVQRTIDVTDIAVISTLVNLTEQLEDTARKLTLNGYQWIKNEYLRDNSGTPYSFVGLREESQFESYFNAHYRVTIR